MRRSIEAGLVVAITLCGAWGAAAMERGELGGQLAETGGHHLLELVVEGTDLTVYVRHDDGEPEETEGAKATATVLAGGQKEDIALLPAGGNALKGSGDLELGPGAVLVITLTMPGHGPEQARVKLD